ncbi:MAG: bifunctional 2-polyprenyl-6-hydroxyphenol methylase/3-demethylubiquinol 3-O-methyltransferase UbiG [Gammaproteobacteria bacterium]|jgi:2-polyprenyl-6-hydroxyphenyl methylase/3-demethylubiquinone-9 3-methyltransferase|nr:bifunctional 2-polyprenyl-6-hydroxyphenol methylase/3-demethylubiquinol 3-O-methyltransferase UbiG [Gammaproteobacteria bacterium]MBT6893105.1 bifunctional 2-polyprenyl-6-hydroxyphenol methylase/3-demethylubiquinol 3-O-methyltransferase UbiG [Gammaproteobacteria bacterium]MDG1230904.1 bifunctional 2-polyprenyl-6-hydroxyphenol methylase/3-demethylubiquinol 3-O-methyltransferase UbiG [Pseudomonadales bacterium]
MSERNVDAAELNKFDELAQKWWDTESEFKPLHAINPLRVGYITDRVNLSGKRVLDVGCGGGILTESLAAQGATVMGIDAAEAPINVAKLHRHESNIHVEYALTTIEELETTSLEPFDVITCLEMLEHVPDPGSVIASCRKLLKNDGHLFLSTINRNPKSYLFAVVGAEYILNMVPKGTHNYDKLITPAELASFCRSADLRVEDLTGMSYNPITQTYKLGNDVDVNYLAHARPEQP